MKLIGDRVFDRSSVASEAIAFAIFLGVASSPTTSGGQGSPKYGQSQASCAKILSVWAHLWL
jgi:hypothetical protein